MSAELKISLFRVCQITGAPRSTIYERLSRGDGPKSRPGPKTEIGDEALTELIRQVIVECPFAGEGHRKVRARLRREHDLHVGKNRVLRLMRVAGLLAPQRVKKRRRPRLHDGVVITEAPNVRWGTDATMAWTRNDGWVWVFALLDHYTDEAWTHAWPRSATASLPSNTSMTPSSIASADWIPTLPEGSSSVTTGAVNIALDTSRGL